MKRKIISRTSTGKTRQIFLQSYQIINLSADQIKILDDHLAKNGEALFKIIAISSQEDRSAVANFINRGGYRVQILLDETGEVGGKYEARNLPATYFIDKNGIARDVFVGILSEKMLVEKIEQLLK